MKKLIVVAVLACIAVVSCNGQEPKDGTTVLLFPEWTNSAHYLERAMATNLLASCIGGKWYVRELEPDGRLVSFWAGNPGYESLDAARRTFGLNIDWNVKVGICDAFSR